MPTRRDPLHSLPVAPGPVQGETLGSYLHRLAVANNRAAGRLVQLLGPLPSEFSPLTDSTAGWTPESPNLLSALVNRPAARLARALPALADFLDPQPASPRPEHVIGRLCRCCTARRSPSATIVIVRAPAHRHLCPRHERWTRSTHDIPLSSLPEVLQAQRRLDLLARRHDRGMQQALDLAWKIIDEWSAGGMPLDLGREWTRRLDHIEAHPVGKKIPFEDRHRLAAFPEIAVLAELILNPPTDTIDPRELYLAATAELSRRFARIYTAIGVHDPLYQNVCRSRAFQTPS
ncbi:TniQ family protein [Kitasatospora brasiliensis]|uniref:TniQ family protein n=1 Tax=Kitasatospora brasiliensis TaxID=3058040 RepID=UPI0029315D9C|nr:TniQ family protein [Kitasatospora sp. K002]